MISFSAIAVEEDEGTYVILNSAPVANNATATVKELEGNVTVPASIDFKTLVSDVNTEDTLAITVGEVSPAGYGSWSHLGDQVYRFTHNGKGNPFEDTLTVSYSVSDGDGGSDTGVLTITVEQINDPPTAPRITLPAAGSAYKNGDSLMLVWERGEDEETAAQDLSYQLQVNYTGAAGEANWSDVTTVNGTAAETVSYTHTIDSTQNSAAMRFRIRTVDQALESGAIAAATSDWAYSPAYILDNTAPSFTVTAKTRGQGYTPGQYANYPIDISFSYGDTGSGVLEYKYLLNHQQTPAPGPADYLQPQSVSGNLLQVTQINEYYLHLYAMDRAGNIHEETVGPFIIHNTPPRPISDTVTVAEGGAATITLRGEDDDYNDGIAGYTPNGGALLYGTLAPALDAQSSPIPGKYVYTHGGSQPMGNDLLPFTVTDRNGTESVAVGTITIKITPVNDPPEITGLGASYSTPEDQPIDISFVISDEEDPPDALRITVRSSNQRVLPDASLAVLRQSNGQITLRATPARDQYTDPGEPITLTVYLRDTDGAAAQKEATLEVTPVNDAPAARDMYFTLLSGSRITGQVTASDVENDPLTFELTGSPPAGGTLTPDGDFGDSGRFSYQADSVFTQDTAQVKISDDQGGSVTITLYFMVGVQAEEDSGPLSSLMVIASGVPSHTSVRLESQDHQLIDPANCQVAISDDDTMTLTLRPQADRYGTTTVTVWLYDGASPVHSYVFPVTISAVNDPPRVVSPNLSIMPQNGEVATGRLLPDDSVDGVYASPGFSFGLSLAPRYGTVTLEPDGSYTYTPDEGFYGEDVFYVLVSELANDPVLNPAPATLPDGVILETGDAQQRLSVVVAVRISVREKPTPQPPPDNNTSRPGGGSGGGRDDDGGGQDPGIWSEYKPLEGIKSPSLSVPEISYPQAGGAAVPPAPAQPGDAALPVQGSESASPPDDTGTEEPPASNPPALLVLEEVLSTAVSHEGGLSLALLLIPAALLILFVIFGARIKVAVEAEQGGEAIEEKTYYCRRVHGRKGMLLKLDGLRADNLETQRLTVRLGPLYRRGFYGRQLTLSVQDRKATVDVPERKAYRKNGIVVEGRAFLRSK